LVEVLQGENTTYNGVYINHQNLNFISANSLITSGEPFDPNVSTRGGTRVEVTCAFGRK